MQKTIIIIGILILLVGLFWPLAKEIPLGRLPGDISVKGEKYSFYFPWRKATGIHRKAYFEF